MRQAALFEMYMSKRDVNVPQYWSGTATKKKKQKRKQKQKTIFLKVTNHVSDLEMISLDPGPNWSILPQSQPD